MTENHHLALLDDRQLIKITGPDSALFMQGLITTDIENIIIGTMYPGALLSPQGKVMFDFLIGRQNSKTQYAPENHNDNDTLFIDIRADQADAFIKRISMFKLRSKVNIIKQDQCIALISDKKPENFLDSSSKNDDNLLFFKDKRLPEDICIFRIYLLNSDAQAFDISNEKWTQIRIDTALAESGSDFELNDAFPHDINYDHIKGLSFTKGCYTGQEVVSRMQHRGTARRRVLIATGVTPLPPYGTVIEAGGKPVGTLGTVLGNKGLALVRIDRVKNALDNGVPITAAGVEVDLAIPPHVGFTFPQTSEDSQ